MINQKRRKNIKMHFTAGFSGDKIKEAFEEIANIVNKYDMTDDDIEAIQGAILGAVVMCREDSVEV